MGINEGRAFRPVVDGETAAVTLELVRLFAVETGVSLNEALDRVLGREAN